MNSYLVARIEALRKELGTFDLDLTLAKLEKLRKEE